MRLFVAIDPPDSVKEYLRTVQSFLPEGEFTNRPSLSSSLSEDATFRRGADIKRMRPERMRSSAKQILPAYRPGRRPKGVSLTRDFHLTLTFLGSCDDGMRKKVEDALSHISFASGEAKTGEIGVFGRPSPRVIWVSLDVPKSMLTAIHEIEKEMSALGFENERGGFVPHITLARVKCVKNPDAFSDTLKAIKISPLVFSISKFCLFESRLSSHGAKHTKLREFPA